MDLRLLQHSGLDSVLAAVAAEDQDMQLPVKYRMSPSSHFLLFNFIDSSVLREERLRFKDLRCTLSFVIGLLALFAPYSLPKKYSSFCLSSFFSHVNKPKQGRKGPQGADWISISPRSRLPLSATQHSAMEVHSLLFLAFFRLFVHLSFSRHLSPLASYPEGSTVYPWHEGDTITPRITEWSHSSRSRSP